MSANNRVARWSRRVSTDTALLSIVVVLMVAANLVSYAYFASLAAGNPSAQAYPIIPGDSVHYAHWGDNILAYHAYEDLPGVPLRAAPPGYPAFLAAMKAITGTMATAAMVQVALTAFALVLIYMMARELVPRRYAALAALAYGLDPMVVLTDTTLLTDALFSALLVCVIYVAFFVRPMKPALRWGFVGILLGLSMMIRPIGEFLVFILPALSILRDWTLGRLNYRAVAAAAAACVIGCAVIVVPWMIRNEIQFRSLEVSPLGGHNLMTFDVRGFLAWRALAGTAHPLPAFLVLRHENDPVFAAVDRQISADLSRMTPEGEDTQTFEGSLAVKYIFADPFRYAYFDVVNTAPFFFSSSVASYGQVREQLGQNTGFYAPASLSLLSSLSIIVHPSSAKSFMHAIATVAPVAFEILWWLLVCCSALAGLWLCRRKFTVILFGLLVAYFAILTGPMSNSRYRIPAEPYLLILSAAGLCSSIAAIRSRISSRSSHS